MITQAAGQWQVEDIPVGRSGDLYDTLVGSSTTNDENGPIQMSSDIPVKLRVARQDLQDFAFFPLSIEGARHWAQALPTTSSSQVAQQLTGAIAQLNRVELPPELRFNIMEELRPALLVATASLSRRFLKQPLLMPEEPRQMAEAADSLFTVAGTAYTTVAAHTIQRKGSTEAVNPARLACESIHRAIRFGGARLLQTFQLYRPVELYSWLAIHQLYTLAEGQELADLTVEDELSGSGTIATAYLQALILGCCKPNQLRQGDLAAIYRGLQEWAALIKVEQDPEQDSLFIVDLDSDRPPMYRQLYRQPPGPRTRYVNTEPLVLLLEKLSAQADKHGVVFDKDTIVSPGLLVHLVAAFSKMSMRNFTRKRVDNAMWVGLGLSACHYRLRGKQSFEQLLYGEGYTPPPAMRVAENPFTERRHRTDAWQRHDPQQKSSAASLSAIDHALEHQVDVDERTLARLMGTDEPDPLEPCHIAYGVGMFDASPGGYCIEWNATLPGHIKTGDIVCLREAESPRWTIACIRWASQVDAQKTLIGLELLSPAAEPYGARMQPQEKDEEEEPTQVLLLPEIKLVGQPNTLITPRTGFRERQKIVLARHGKEFFIQLTRQVAITGSFLQFEFRYIKQLGEVLDEDKSRPRDTGYDSLWTNI